MLFFLEQTSLFVLSLLSPRTIICRCSENPERVVFGGKVCTAESCLNLQYVRLSMQRVIAPIVTSQHHCVNKISL